METKNSILKKTMTRSPFKFASKLVNKVTVTFVLGLVTLAWLVRKQRLRKKESAENPAPAEEEEQQQQQPLNSTPPSVLPTPLTVGNEAFDFDVFLSFRGDTRDGFTSHLHQRLTLRGVRTFIDEKDLKKGEKITKLMQCIERSNIFIPVFSRGYAESRWCLMEITKIVQSKRLIIPVFYNVDPSDVRSQKGPFARAFAVHRKKEDREKVEEWRKALTEVGGISGYDLSAKSMANEATLIEVILKDVQLVLSKLPMEVALHPVGIASRVADVLNLLDLDGTSDAVRMVGIHGEGGLGKTTIAKAVYNRLRQTFQGCSFLLNVRERTNQPNGLASLQSQLLKDILEQKNASINDVDQGIATIKQRLKSKKVLLVLDDVDSKEQLDKLAGEPTWFGAGSRIIISTRDQWILDWHRVDGRYQPEVLDRDQSLQLFSLHAFASDRPLPEYEELSRKVLEYAGGMPLALEVFGPIFFKIRNQKEWLEILEKLKAVQHNDLCKRLKVSYEALDEEEKCIFLDIACCFHGKELKYQWYMWEAMNYHPNVTIKSLQYKSLVKMENHKFMMHDQIRDMGRNIVKAEAFHDPGMRSRLWNHTEISPILEEPRDNVEVIVLEYEYKSQQHMEEVGSSAFSEMPRLRFLTTKHVTFGDEALQFPRRIKCLQLTDGWTEALAFDTGCLQELVVLDLSNGESISRISWSNRPISEPSRKRQLKNVIPNLRVLNLENCRSLVAIPDFSAFPRLEKLVLDSCDSLVEVGESIGVLKSLVYLSLRWCRTLERLPDSIGQLKNLETLDLSNCRRLGVLPETVGGLKSLRTLHLPFTRLVELPEEIGKLTSLEELNLDYTPLEGIPESIGDLIALRELGLKSTDIWKLPDSLGKLSNLSALRLEKCKNLVETPNFSGCSEIRKLELDDCYSLTQIESVSQLKNLIFLSIESPKLNHLPESICQLKDLEALSLLGCGCICQLPETLGSLASLKKLSAAFTNVRNLPTSTTQLTRLSLLNLSGSKLEELPEDIGSLKSLERLILDKTPLKKILNSLGKLTNLRTLSLSKCCFLEELPDSIGELKSLEELKLDDTPLKAVPGSLNGLSSLKELNLSRTNITKITQNNTSSIQLTRLSKLDLGDTKLEELPEEIGNLESLKTLILVRTPLKKLPDSIGSLVNLEVLKLSTCCHLEQLPDTIGGLKSLKELQLDGTPLLAVPNSINGLSSLRSLNLSGTNITEITQTSNLEGLSSLEDLRVNECPNLCSLPRLPHSLEFLWARDSTALEGLPDMTKLGKLRQLDLKNCKKLIDNPSVDSLFRLRYPSLTVDWP